MSSGLKGRKLEPSVVFIVGWWELFFFLPKKDIKLKLNYWENVARLSNCFINPRCRFPQALPLGPSRTEFPAA